MCVISVVDTGIGMDASHLDVIFEPFFQVSSYETRQHQGAGLGLSITKQLVELHHSRVNVVSKVGVGTTFQIYIPTTPPPRQETVSPQTVGSLLKPREAEPNMFEAWMPAVNTETEVSMPSAETTPQDLALERITPAQTDKKRETNIQPLFPSVDDILDPNSAQPNGNQIQAVRPLFSISDTPISGENSKKDISNVPSVDAGTDVSSVVIEPKKTQSSTIMTKNEESLANNVPSELMIQGSKDSLHQEPLRVLAVDDTPLNLKVVSNFLVKADMLVDTATDGQHSCLTS